MKAPRVDVRVRRAPRLAMASLGPPPDRPLWLENPARDPSLPRGPRRPAAHDGPTRARGLPARPGDRNLRVRRLLRRRTARPTGRWISGNGRQAGLSAARGAAGKSWSWKDLRRASGWLVSHAKRLADVTQARAGQSLPPKRFSQPSTSSSRSGFSRRSSRSARQRAALQRVPLVRAQDRSAERLHVRVERLVRGDDDQLARDAAARSTSSRITVSASSPAGGTRRVSGPRSCAAMSARSGCPSKTRVARAPLRAAEGGHAAHDLVPGGRPAARTAPGPEQVVAVDQVRHAGRGQRQILTSLRKKPFRSSSLLRRPGPARRRRSRSPSQNVQRSTLDALEVLFLHLVAALRALHEVLLPAAACAPPSASCAARSFSRFSRATRAASRSCFSLARNHSSSRLRSSFHDRTSSSEKLPSLASDPSRLSTNDAMCNMLQRTDDPPPRGPRECATPGGPGWPTRSPSAGSIDPKAFPFLLVDLHRHGATGSLKVDGPSYQKALYFRGGRILFGSSNDPRDQLGAILIESGKITPGAARGRQRQGGPGQPAGQGPGRHRLREPARAVRGGAGQGRAHPLRRVAYDTGSFEFEDGVLPKGAVDLKLSTERLVLAAVRRVTDRNFVLRHLDGLEVVLRPDRRGRRACPRSRPTPGTCRSSSTARTLKEAAARDAPRRVRGREDRLRAPVPGRRRADERAPGGAGRAAGRSLRDLGSDGPELDLTATVHAAFEDAEPRRLPDGPAPPPLRPVRCSRRRSGSSRRRAFPRRRPRRAVVPSATRRLTRARRPVRRRPPRS